MNLRLWGGFEKQLKSVSGAADSVKRFAMGETGNPYRFDSDDKGVIKFFAFNAKKFLQSVLIAIYWFLSGGKLDGCYYKEYIR